MLRQTWQSYEKLALVTDQRGSSDVCGALSVVCFILSMDLETHSRIQPALTNRTRISCIRVLSSG